MSSPVSDDMTLLSCLDHALRSKFVAIHITWPAEFTETRNAMPVEVTLAISDGPVVVITALSLQSEPVAARLRALLVSEVIKVGWDMRSFVDCALHAFNARMVYYIDVALALTLLGIHTDVHPGRMERGVTRLPELLDYVNVPFGSTTPHLCIALGLRDMGEALLATLKEPEQCKSVLYKCEVFATVLRDKPERSYGTEELNPFVPTGVLGPRGDPEIMVPCSVCHRLVQASDLAPNTASDETSAPTCVVCYELTLPCLHFKRSGKCLQSRCPYTHHVVLCSAGSLCVTHVATRMCPYFHADEMASIDIDSPQLINTGTTALTEDDTTPPTMSSRRERRQRLRVLKHQKQVPRERPAETHPLNATNSELNTTLDVTAENNVSAENITMTEEEVSYLAREDVSVFYQTPILFPKRLPPPCYHHFENPDGCRYGAKCKFSHKAIPVYIPVSVPTPCHKGDLTNFQICKSYASRAGRCTNGAACPMLHVPYEVMKGKGVHWGDLPKPAC